MSLPNLDTIRHLLEKKRLVYCLWFLLPFVLAFLLINVRFASMYHAIVEFLVLNHTLLDFLVLAIHHTSINKPVDRKAYLPRLDWKQASTASQYLIYQQFLRNPLHHQTVLFLLFLY